MRPSTQRGSALVILSFSLTVVLLIVSVGFGIWAYSRAQDYKNNVDMKISVAVEAAKQQESSVKDAQFAQDEKLPYRTYTGPTAYGSITIKYPKTWSAYVSDDANSSPFINGYFYPNVVPDTQSQNSVFALRVQVIQDSYVTVLGTVSTYVQQGETKVAAYAAPNVPSVVGSRIDGKLTDQRKGSMIVLPLRNMTLKLWTEGPSFGGDFNTILQNFSFSP